MIEPQQIWSKFRTAFCDSLTESDKREFAQAWKTVQDKTEFYKSNFMWALARRMDYELEREKQRCDFAFLKDGIPLIYAETENQHPKASHEIDCLCCVAAPLKVLILSCNWQETEKEKFLPGWIEIIQRHHAVVTMDCLYAIVVGEWGSAADAPLEYSFTLIDPDGTILDEFIHDAGSLPAG